MELRFVFNLTETLELHLEFLSRGFWQGNSSSQMNVTLVLYALSTSLPVTVLGQFDQFTFWESMASLGKHLKG